MDNARMNQRPCTGQNGALKAEIRQAVDGWSLFTWSDHGGTIGVSQWRESHELDWQAAYGQFIVWLSGVDDFKLFYAAYVEALLWSSTDETPDGETVNLDEFELSTAGADTCRADCAAFFTANYADICEAAKVYGFDHAGHDFALTRNGHGAGFWAGDLPDALGERLTEAAHAVGECWPYLGDDGSVYL